MSLTHFDSYYRTTHMLVYSRQPHMTLFSFRCTGFVDFLNTHIRDNEELHSQTVEADELLDGGDIAVVRGTKTFYNKEGQHTRTGK